jgi:hypothetical protein
VLQVLRVLVLQLLVLLVVRRLGVVRMAPLPRRGFHDLGLQAGAPWHGHSR